MKDATHFIEVFSHTGDSKTHNSIFLMPINILRECLNQTILTGLYTVAIFKIKAK